VLIVVGESYVGIKLRSFDHELTLGRRMHPIGIKPAELLSFDSIDLHSPLAGNICTTLDLLTKCFNK
jgi:hypothetical protein